MDTKRAMGIHTDPVRATGGLAAPDQTAGEAPHRGRGLSRERIVAGALGYVHRNCLAELSMRRLGTELGVEAMSLYRYFPSKAALFDALLEAALSQIAPLDGDTPDWESAVRCYAQSFRRFARSQPRLFPLLASAGPGQRSMDALMERMLDMWQRAGLDQATSRFAQRAVHSFTIGTITAEVGVSFGRPDEDRGSWCAKPARIARDKAAPAVDPLIAQAERDSTFEFGLNVLIEGLRDRFAAHRRSPSPVLGS